MLTELSLEALLDREFVGHHRAERVQIAEVLYVRYQDRSIVKTYDYINRIVLMLPLSVYEAMWTTLSPLVAMHHHDPVWRRNFFEITTFPNSGTRAWFYV